MSVAALLTAQDVEDCVVLCTLKMTDNSTEPSLACCVHPPRSLMKFTALINDNFLAERKYIQQNILIQAFEHVNGFNPNKALN